MRFGLFIFYISNIAWSTELGIVDPSQRVDCEPEPSVTKELCLERGCIWASTSTPKEQEVPSCYYPPETGYFVVKEAASGRHWKKTPGSVKNPYCDDAQILNFELSEIGNAVRLTIGTDDSFVPDININSSPKIESSEKLTLKIRNTTTASFTVERKDGTRIWDTSIGGLIFGEKYIQIATFIPTHKIYGFGEHIHQTLMHDLSRYKTWAAYSHGKDLCDVTLCMLAVVNRGKTTIFNVKSMYGLKELIATNRGFKATTSKRGQIISRSTFPSSGHYGGHWLGDNRAHWEDLRTAIIGTQEFNLFGIPHVGSDVCGFINSTTEELCLRWQQLGAFHSFFRNHNDIDSSPQDPTQWQSVTATTRTANLFRYRHLPYLYTLHFIASIYGGTVVRPVFFEFPQDVQTFELSYQFMWGSAIMVMPVTDSGVTTVDGYLPEDGEWYYLYSDFYGTQAPSGRGTFDSPKNSSAPSFIRGGYVVPRQVPALTTTDARKNHFQLVIACNQNIQPVNVATGEFYWDDGETWVDPESDFSDVDYYHFTYNFTYSAFSASLDINLVKMPKNRLVLPAIEQIEVFGYLRGAALKTVKVNDKDANIDLRESSYSGATKILRLSKTRNGFITLNDHLTKWTVAWQNVS